MCHYYLPMCRCNGLQSELDSVHEDMETMNEQILKVAKQKYELQLQLEAWQVCRFMHPH